ncbi:hypothetical protein F4810DRAFT_693162 [Camillea tinctor]|nr:hypothetical protein F4810DRAFT_693162 [Camillea tinctor]
MEDDLFQDGFLAHAWNNNQSIDLNDVNFASLANLSGFEPESIQDDFAGSDILVREAHESWGEDTSNYNLTSVGVGNIPIRAEEADQSKSLDMNDPTTLATFTSLVLFKNNPSTQHIEFKDCDQTKQAVFRALAIKLSLGYSYDASRRTVQLRKDSIQEIFPSQAQQPPCRDDDLTSDQWRLSKIGGTQPQFNVEGDLDTDSNSQFATSFPSNEREKASFNQEMSPDGTGASGLKGRNTDVIEPPQCNIQNPGSHNLYNLRSDHVSTQSVSSSIASRAWRSSSSGLSRTLKAIGACWRCKILRKKCDADEPCKACPKAENKSLWQSIGCRRGTLLDHSPEICLCSKSTSLAESHVAHMIEAFTSNTSLVDFMVNDTRLVLQNATTRLEEVISSVDDTYNKVVLDILCSPIIDLPRVRCQEHNLQSNILNIVWGLVDDSSIKSVLRIENIESVAEMMKAASIYETEYGTSNISSLAIECLRNCVDILRFSCSLTPMLHANCSINQCEIESFRLLASNMTSFLNEFSNVIFRKENRPPGRKWWLSAFYGLYLQSFVRRSIMFLGDLSLAQVSASNLTLSYDRSTYLRLALELFEAASASYDPLISTWSLDKEPSEPKLDFRLIKYYRTAQQVLNTSQWPQDKIHSSMEFLKSMYSDESHESKPTPLKHLDVLPISNMEPTQQQLGVNIQPPPNNTESGVIYEDGQQNSFTNKESLLLSRFKDRPLAPLRTKRRAGSPPGGITSLQRNDSSSSVLNTLSIRHPGLAITSQNSPISSSLSFSYDTSSSALWNGSEESLASLLRTDSPVFPGSSKRGSTSLHTKSSSESFLEMPRSLNHQKSRPSLSGLNFPCNCCPTRPKMFDSPEARKAHESKRKYKCSYCGHRFKTKNDTERHEKSLHIRRRAWSCSMLLALEFQDSFHDSPEAPGSQIICNYCGIGISIPKDSIDAMSISPGDQYKRMLVEYLWEDHHKRLIEHLQKVHQVGQCNAAKKFYRADHFRQHLKHSHNATLGKWTSVLESKCMKEEDPVRRSNT